MSSILHSLIRARRVTLARSDDCLCWRAYVMHIGRRMWCINVVVKCYISHRIFNQMLCGRLLASNVMLSTGIIVIVRSLMYVFCFIAICLIYRGIFILNTNLILYVNITTKLIIKLKQETKWILLWFQLHFFMCSARCLASSLSWALLSHFHASL